MGPTCQVHLVLLKYKYIKSAGDGIVWDIWTHIIVQYQIWVVFNLHHSWSFASSRSHSRNPSAQGRPAIQGHCHPERRKVKRFSWALNQCPRKPFYFSHYFWRILYIRMGQCDWKMSTKWWENVQRRKYNGVKWSLSTSLKISSELHCNMNAMIKEGFSSHQVQHISKWSVFGMIHDHLEEI